jgi:hypothetical protein
LSVGTLPGRAAVRPGGNRDRTDSQGFALSAPDHEPGAASRQKKDWLAQGEIIEAEVLLMFNVPKTVIARWLRSDELKHYSRLISLANFRNMS